MTFVIAAAGTGGHVFPGLSVGEALVDLGVPRCDITYVGGSRLESKVYPDQGFPFFEVELQGLKRSLTVENLKIPGVVVRARRRIRDLIRDIRATAVLGMGGYVTIPTALAARSAGVPFFNAEQNAEAGLANRVSARWAETSFVAFPNTGGLPRAEWVGNPVRKPFWAFDRSSHHTQALAKYGLDPSIPVLGVFGGSLGAGVLNDATIDLVARWHGPPLQIVHLTGGRNIDQLAEVDEGSTKWVRIGFEDSMVDFFAACDLVVARAGGAVAEITATATPAILVPGEFGSSGHQTGNARFLDDEGAARTLLESELDTLPAVVESTLYSPEALRNMRKASEQIARPRAAHAIARSLLGVNP